MTSTAHLLIHLWDKAVKTPGYDKSEWAELQRRVTMLEDSVLGKLTDDMLLDELRRRLTEKRRP